MILQPADPLPGADYSVTVRVLVGDEEKEYTVPECLLTRTSASLKAACSTRWEEGQEWVIRLPDQDIAS